MDAARTSLRLGAEAHIVYRRTMEELPARAEEVEYAQEEGVIFDLLTSPIEFKGNEEGRVTSMICQRYELGEPDESGRRRPVPIKGDVFEMKVDTVIISIGQGPNPLCNRLHLIWKLINGGTLSPMKRGVAPKPVYLPVAI